MVLPESERGLDQKVTPTLVFDIETVPDTAGFAKLHNLEPGLGPDHIAEIAYQQRRQSSGSDFLQLHLHRIVAISCALREPSGLKIWSLGDLKDSEADLIRRFFDGIEKYSPQLVSWNGGSFDLPVLHYRALIHGIQASRYWDLGDDDREFKWNNYISRYHTRHLDLMDVLALYQPRAYASLDQLAKLCGLPGKLGMDGSQVWTAYQRGELEAIRSYCETDVANTYLLYLRFQLLRGALSQEKHCSEVALVRSSLKDYAGTHWREFLQAWEENPPP